MINWVVCKLMWSMVNRRTDQSVTIRDGLDTCLVSIPVSVFVSFVPPIPAPILCAWYCDTAAGIDTSAGIDTATSIDTTVGVKSTQVAGILLI